MKAVLLSMVVLSIASDDASLLQQQQHEFHMHQSLQPGWDQHEFHECFFRRGHWTNMHNILSEFDVDTLDTCQQECIHKEDCVAFSYTRTVEAHDDDSPYCILHTSLETDDGETTNDPWQFYECLKGSNRVHVSPDNRDPQWCQRMDRHRGCRGPPGWQRDCACTCGRSEEDCRVECPGGSSEIHAACDACKMCKSTELYCTELQEQGHSQPGCSLLPSWQQKNAPPDGVQVVPTPPPTAPAPTPVVECVFKGDGTNQQDILDEFDVDTLDTCQQKCKDREDCAAFSYTKTVEAHDDDSPYCILHSEVDWDNVKTTDDPWEFYERACIDDLN